MVKCTFTGKECSPHTGIHLIKNDGTIEFYSSSKAMKNALKLGRDKRKVKWTEAFHIARDKAREKHRLAEENKNSEKKVEVKKVSKKKN